MVYCRYPKSSSLTLRSKNELKEHVRIEKLRAWASGSRIKHPFNDKLIIVGSPIYRDLVAECKKNSINVDFCSQYTWVMVIGEESPLYDVNTYIRCRRCSREKFTFIVHTDENSIGEYVCIHCGKDADIRNKCMHCEKAH